MSAPLFTSTYGMLDVEKGRVKLASYLKNVAPVDVLIRATLTEPFGSNDGTSIEFNMTVHSVELASVDERPEGQDPQGLEAKPASAIGAAETPKGCPEITRLVGEVA